MKALSNLVAECPQCTMTQCVSIEAMRAKGGWVRCVGCQQIFDGFEAMSAQASSSPELASTQPELSPSVADQANANANAPAWGVSRRPAAKRIQTPEPSVDVDVDVDVGEKASELTLGDLRMQADASLDPWEVAGGDAEHEQPIESMMCLPIEPTRPVLQSMQDEDFVVEWSSEAIVASMKPVGDVEKINTENALPERGAEPDKPAMPELDSSPAPWQTRRRALRVGATADDAGADVIDSRATKAQWEREADARKETMRKAMESGGSWLHHWGARAMGGQYAWSRIMGRPKSKRWRLGMSLGCVGLMAISAAQGAYFYKEQIAAHNPKARPFMEKACKAIGCEVGLAQAKADIDLDGAQVLLDDQGRLVFTATLRSRADIESKAPRLWLALEGDDGEIVAARIMEPEQWVGSGSIKPGQEMEAKLTFPAIKEGLSGFKARLVWADRG